MDVLTKRGEYGKGGEFRMPRKDLKDGWRIYNEWVSVEDGKRVHWVETGCCSCSVYTVTMPLSKLVAQGPNMCDGCEAYQGHLY